MAEVQRPAPPHGESTEDREDEGSRLHGDVATEEGVEHLLRAVGLRGLGVVDPEPVGEGVESRLFW